MPTKSIMISYARSDQPQVSKIVNTLQQLGNDVWTDEERAAGSSGWESVLDHIDRCTIFLFAVSPSSLQSEECRSERQYAMALGKPVLPVKVGQVNLPGESPDLAALPVVDYTRPGEDSVIHLVNAVQTMPEPAPPPEPPPQRPPVPTSYLSQLAHEARSATTVDAQLLVIQKLGMMAESGEDQQRRAEAAALLAEMAARPDLMAAAEHEISAIQQRLPARTAEPPGTAPGSPPGTAPGSPPSPPPGSPPSTAPGGPPSPPPGVTWHPTAQTTTATPTPAAPATGAPPTYPGQAPAPQPQPAGWTAAPVGRPPQQPPPPPPPQHPPPPGVAPQAPPPKANRRPLIWAALAVAAAVLLIGCVGGAVLLYNARSDDGQPSTSATAATAGPTAGPTAEATAAPPPVMDERLRVHIPPVILITGDCSPAAAHEDAESAIECRWRNTDVPRAARYTLFADDRTMQAYAEELFGGTPSSTSCASAADLSGDGGRQAYSVNGRDRGTVWCYTNQDGEPVLLWVDPTLNIAAWAIAPTTDDYADLRSWFRSAGPQ